MKIAVDATRCIGSGQCTLAAPALFDQREEDGTVILRDPEPAADHHGAAREAAQACPSRTIIIDDE